MNRSDICTAYLKRLGVDRDQPSLQLLESIAQRHLDCFPFASIGPRLGDELPLDLEALYDRIVARQRGGYCFEQNGLLFEILEELGFDVTLYLARVIFTGTEHPGLTHRVTLVDLDGDRYLVDVGFGAMGPRRPVRVDGVYAEQGHRTFRVAAIGDRELHLQTIKDGEDFSLYRFELTRYGQADCELGHFFSHRSSQAVFVNHLVVARVLADETRSLVNRDYRITSATEEQATEVGDADQLQTILREDFDLEVSTEESQRLFEPFEP